MEKITIGDVSFEVSLSYDIMIIRGKMYPGIFHAHENGLWKE